MSRYPTQERAVDPFASYNSDTVNELTKMITNGDDSLFSPKAIDVIQDSTAPNDFVVVTPGIVFKDNILIEITANHSVDFNDATHYFGGSVVKEPGNYYIVLSYDFVKSRPAPQAAVLILTPTEVGGGAFNNSSLLLLKVLQITTGPFSINSFLDYNPSIPADRRVNTSQWVSVENTLPTFSQDPDWGRIIYVRDEDSIYFGLFNKWVAIDALGNDLLVDSTATLTSLVYFSGTAWDEAIASDPIRFAQGVVINTSPAKVQFAGVMDAKVETAVTIVVGDRVYLSNSEEGTITNVATAQEVGTALEGGTGSVSILFNPQLLSGRLILTNEPSFDASIENHVVQATSTDWPKAGLASMGEGVCIWSDGSGAGGAIIQLSGYVEKLTLETGVVVVKGQHLWLSGSENGTVTDIRPTNGAQQFIGIAMGGGTGPSTIPALISIMRPTRFQGQISSWTLSGTEYYGEVYPNGLYAESLDKAFLVQCWDNSTREVIQPFLIERTATNTVRIWMPVNTVTLDVVVFG